MSGLAPLLRRLVRWVNRTAMLACGIPDYDGYLAHMRATHPGDVPLAYGEFFRQRQDARYQRGGRSPCC